MPRRKIVWNENKFKRYIKEGRGKGEGKNYIPWIKTREVPSKGRRGRPTGWKTGRLHHFLSDHESRYFYTLEWVDAVTDIREQFPIIDFETTQEIAEEMGIKHPTDPKSGFPCIITTDFLITVNIDGKTKQVARTIKPSEQLNDKRTIEKFEIERRYWAAKEIDWGIVTEKEIPKTLANNVWEIHHDYYLEPTDKFTKAELYGVADSLKENLSISKQTISEATNKLDTELGFESGFCLSLFRYLVARKEIIIDLNSKLDFTKSAQSILHINFDTKLKRSAM